MRGHLVKRARDTWSIKYSLGKDVQTGKYRYQWETVKGSKKDAEQRLAEVLHQLDTGAYVTSGKTPAAEYFTRWLQEYVYPNLSPQTAEGYSHILQRHLIPTIGNIYLSKLKPEHLQRYYSDKLTSGLSAQTVRHHHTVLHRALQCAVEWELIARNVADAVSPPRTIRPDIQTWNESEVSRFLEAAKTTAYYEIFYLALFTGMRRSEILALRWQDIDFIYGQVSVNHSLHVLKNATVIFSQPKTAAGRRTIALPPSALLILTEYRHQKDAESLLFDKPMLDSDLIFSTLGKPLLPNTVTHAWIKLVKRTGLKAIRLHDARHTHASILLKQGVHPKIVQERLGHSSIQITLDTYSHVAPGLQMAAAQRFDDAFQVGHNDSVSSKLVAKPLYKVEID